ncbi:hypothetical protein ACJMK2_040341 [Sinanodonta woodiana]|uniref:Uncharacterized protein n=1 Tax=Sinanodonta woodiana TaxID=1069815 RepID=A0ABD3WEQ1_SINWO
MSAGRTVLSQHIPSNRFITQFPKPFSADATPYREVDFHPKVKKACSEKKIGRVRMCHEVFEKDYKATIGVDFEVEKFSVLECPFTVQIVLQICHNLQVVWLVFWLGTPCTREIILELWSMSYCLTYNCISPAAYSQIESRIKMIANNLGAEYLAVSAKTGENVHEFFFRVVALTFDAAVLSEVDTALAPRATQIGTISDEENKDPRVEVTVALLNLQHQSAPLLYLPVAVSVHAKAT